MVAFARERGWTVADGRVHFPVEEALQAGAEVGGGGPDGAGPAAAPRSERDILAASGTIIENTIGYARELETIV